MLTIYKPLLLKFLFLTFGLIFSPAVSFAQDNAARNLTASQHNNVSYDDIIGIALESELAVDLVIKKIKKLPASQTIGVRPDRKRVLITGEVQSLIRGKQGLNSEIKFLFDMPIDSRGKTPKLKKRRFIAFGAHVEGRSDFIRLTHTASMLRYSERVNNMVRSSIKEVLASNAPQQINAVTSAFHSPGTIIGEGETQIFLETQFGQPMAISVTSKRGQNRRWSVSTSEVIDINATEPRRLSLIGYRLACSLPRTLSPSKVEANNQADRAKTISDYKLVIDSMGPCERKLDWK